MKIYLIFVLLFSLILVKCVSTKDIEFKLKQMWEHQLENDIEIGPTVYSTGGIYADTIEQMIKLGINTEEINHSVLREAFMSAPQLIRSNGYSTEVHNVITIDGYILEMHRITSSPNAPFRTQKQPVLLVHGVLDSSGTWIIMGSRNGLGYLLADMGYDVWLGNSRGNRYSRQHIQWNPDGNRMNRNNFWDFSFHDVGTIDLPAMIDYVLEETSFEKLHYIGHSQGTTAFFVMASELPNYNDKVIAMQALAPVAFMSNLKSPIVRLAAYYYNSMKIAAQAFGLYEFMPNSEMIASGAQAGCHDDSIFQILCTNIIFLIAGFNSVQLNTTRVPVIAGHTPAGSSSKTFLHFGQLIRSGHFRKFDYGIFQNILTYGSFSPPAYNLKNIRTPVSIHYSSNDWLSDVSDVHLLSQNLGNLTGKFLVQDARFNHLDFIWANDVETLVYRKMFNLMRLAERGELP